jgi:hypothetical protein
MTEDTAAYGRQPTREEINREPGPLVLEFGTDW